MPAQSVAGGVQGIGSTTSICLGQRGFHRRQGQRFGDEGGTAFGLRLQQARGRHR
jgi:hypothetical protein